MKEKQPKLTWLTIKTVLKDSQLTYTEGLLGIICVAMLLSLFVMSVLNVASSRTLKILTVIIIGMISSGILLWLYTRIRYTLQVSRILIVSLCPAAYQIQSVDAYIDKVERLRTCDKLIAKFTDTVYFSIDSLHSQIRETIHYLSKDETLAKDSYDSLRCSGLFDPFGFLTWYK